MSGKIAKTIARQKEKIVEGNFYEAHQQLRVVASRYIKAADYDNAADILSNGASLLLKAGQGGSGSDLSTMLLNDVYDKGSRPCTEANKTRLVEILNAFPRGEPTRKRFAQDMIAWSCKAAAASSSSSSSSSESEISDRGDPELHHAVGSLLADEGEDPYEAERHLVQGSRASIPLLIEMHYSWYATDSPHLAATYASRSLFPYLILGKLSSANEALSLFTSHLTTSNPKNLFVQSIDSARSHVRVFPSLPLLNFLSLLLLACQKADAGLFKQLAKHYAVHLKEVEELWGTALAYIGETWFGVRIPNRGGNPLFDMMGSMFFGGGGAAAGGRGKAAVQAGSAGGSAGGSGASDSPRPVTPAPPPTMDLD